MHHDLVDGKRWISERRFLHALNYCMVLPGPEAQQLATYIGWLMHRTWGGIVAGALFVLPSLIILIALSWLYMAYGDVPAVAGILYGIKPAVVAIVLHAAWRIGTRALKRPTLWAIAAAAFVAIFAFRVPFPLIVLAAGLIGYIGGRVAPREFAVGGAHGEASGAHAPAVIDDDTPTPPHARFRWSRLALVVAISVALWLFALAMLVASFGPGSTLPRMGWFFTKAALLTFGGAYAVLPYVYQGAVETYAWLTPVQMVDGLALGETTPGPLIMVVAFVGFVGGWTKAIFGPDALAHGRHRGRVRRDVLHVPAVVPVHSRGRPAGRDHARPAALHRAAFRHHRGGRRRDRQSRDVLRVARVLAAWVGRRRRRCAGSMPLGSLIGVAAAVALFRFKAGVIPVILACGADRPRAASDGPGIMTRYHHRNRRDMSSLKHLHRTQPRLGR